MGKRKVNESEEKKVDDGVQPKKSESDGAQCKESKQTEEKRCATVDDKIWSLEMLNHPSWNFIENLVEKYNREMELAKENSCKVTKKAATSTSSSTHSEKVLRKFKKYKSQYKKYKNKLRQLQSEEDPSTKDEST